MEKSKSSFFEKYVAKIKEHLEEPGMNKLEFTEPNKISRLEIAYLEHLSKENQIEIIKKPFITEAIEKMEQYDLELINDLLSANKTFLIVFYISAQYITENHSIKQLVIAGNKGLINSIQRFEKPIPEKKLSLVKWWIKQAVLEEINPKVIE